MKIKTSELTGAALDRAVAKALGYVEDGVYGIPEWSNGSLYLRYCGAVLQEVYSPSNDWAQGGPIIERERIQLRIDEQGNNCAVKWIKGIGYGPRVEGPTPLIAAMRAFVASKLGDEVEIPEELAQ